MYNNMSRQLGTEACKEYLESNQFPEGWTNEFLPSTNSILVALDLCLNSNYFTFDGKVYKQKSGVGTGMKLSPTYACLGIGKFEEKMFSSAQTLLEKIILWKRFIDDVLMLFKGSEHECIQLVDWLNSLMPGIVKFKYEFSFEKVNFLDLEIFIENGLLMTNLFIKPTNSQLFLDFNSNHPEHCKEAIPFSQALRVVERCSSSEERDIQLKNLKTKFQERNYPEQIIEKQFLKAKSKERKDLIFQKRKPKGTGDKKVRLVFTHNAANPPIHKWVREAKKHLERNDQAKEIGQRIQIANKQPPNLQRIVGGCKTSSSSRPEPNPGCFKCGKCRVLCPKNKRSQTLQ